MIPCTALRTGRPSLPRPFLVDASSKMVVALCLALVPVESSVSGQGGCHVAPNGEFEAGANNSTSPTDWTVTGGRVVASRNGNNEWGFGPTDGGCASPPPPPPFTLLYRYLPEPVLRTSLIGDDPAPMVHPFVSLPSPRRRSGLKRRFPWSPTAPYPSGTATQK